MLTGTICLAPKAFPGSDTLRMPVFFPLFWLAVEYDASEKRGRVRVIKVMDEQGLANGSSAPRQEEGMLLNRLVLTRPDDTVKEVDLDGFKVKEGEAFEFSL